VQLGELMCELGLGLALGQRLAIESDDRLNFWAA
jgi:hypothetical protein